jgi:OmpA family
MNSHFVLPTQNSQHQRLKWPLYWLAVAIVFIGGTYYYDCRIKRVCGNPSMVVMALPPLHFGWNDAQAKLEPEFAKFKQDLISTGANGDALTITGVYYRDELAQQTSAIDLGTLRAQAAAELFSAELVPERIQIRSRLDNGNAPVGDAKRFAAVEFDWTALIATNMEQVAPALAFARNSTVPVTGPGFDAMQSALNTGGSNQLLEITGLWFEGEDEALGLQRAQAVAALFTSWLPNERTQLLTRFAGATTKPLMEASMFRWIDSVPAAIGAPAAISIAPTATPTELQVYFDSNGSEILQIDKTRVAIQTFVNQAAGKRIVITGHTDSSGRSKKNRALGLRRAAALRDAILTAGFSGEIRLISASDAKPVSDNLTANGKALNRRASAAIE